MPDGGGLTLLTVRYIFGAAIFLIGWSVVLLTGAGEDDGLAFLLASTASIAAGLIARSWLIVPLALATVPLAAIQPCDSAVYECDVNMIVIALMMFVPLAATFLAIGVGAAKLAGRWRTRAPHT